MWLKCYAQPRREADSTESNVLESILIFKYYGNTNSMFFEPQKSLQINYSKHKWTAPFDKSELSKSYFTESDITRKDEKLGA